MYDAISVGADPAGLSAALWLGHYRRPVSPQRASGISGWTRLRLRPPLTACSGRSREDRYDRQCVIQFRPLLVARKRVPAMDASPQNRSGSNASQEVANLGMVRPPLVYGAAIVTGLLLEFGWPLPFLPGLLAALLGSVLVVVAVVVFSYSIRTFQTAGTPVPGNKPTTVIVRTGPYRFSRNPIYLAFSIF
jgi:hypothetical protein